MSWFSDFAKTALNEAQKRIDKVLDIEEDETTKNESSNSKLFRLFFFLLVLLNVLDLSKLCCYIFFSILLLD